MADTTTTAAHVDKSTLTVSIYDPEHAQRVTTALFTRTRDEILANEPVCFLCGQLPAVVGPLELHHCNVERMFAEIIDWPIFAAAAKAGEIGWTPNQRLENQNWDWDSFLTAMKSDPMKCYDYVDNMHLNGMPLCKPHHTGVDEGIHAVDFPRYWAQRYIMAGYKYSDVYTIDSDDLRLKAISEDETITP
jgi:hypothetical protein